MLHCIRVQWKFHCGTVQGLGSWEVSKSHFLTVGKGSTSSWLTLPDKDTPAHSKSFRMRARQKKKKHIPGHPGQTTTQSQWDVYIHHARGKTMLQEKKPGKTKQNKKEKDFLKLYLRSTLSIKITKMSSKMEYDQTTNMYDYIKYNCLKLLYFTKSKQ